MKNTLNLMYRVLHKTEKSVYSIVGLQTVSLLLHTLFILALPAGGRKGIQTAMKYFFLFIKKTLRFILKPLSFAPAILVMYMIFYLSGQDGATSSQLSYKVSTKVVVTAEKLLKKNFTKEQIAHYADRIHFYIRKLGHVTEYFILAVTIAFPLYVYRIRGWWLMLVAGLFCLGFAAMDEYRQSFVSGRVPSRRDVAIDSIGIFTGIVLVRVMGWIGRMTVFRPLSNK